MLAVVLNLIGKNTSFFVAGRPANETEDGKCQITTEKPWFYFYLFTCSSVTFL